MGTGCMQAIVDRYRRQPEEGGNVLMRAFMDEEQRCCLAQTVRQLGNRSQRRGGLPPLLEDVVGRRLVARQFLGLGQRYRVQLLSPQHPAGMMANDAPEPA